MLKTFSFLCFALPSQDANIKPAAEASNTIIQFTCLIVPGVPFPDSFDSSLDDFSKFLIESLLSNQLK